MTGAVEANTRVINVYAVQCRGNSIGVTLTPDFSICDDIQTRILLGSDGQKGRILHGFFKIRLFNSPKFFGSYSGRKTARQLRSIDQPIGLRITANNGGGKQHKKPL